jgi:hypothetical protein
MASRLTKNRPRQFVKQRLAISPIKKRFYISNSLLKTKRMPPKQENQFERAGDGI